MTVPNIIVGIAACIVMFMLGFTVGADVAVSQYKPLVQEAIAGWEGCLDFVEQLKEGVK